MGMKDFLDWATSSPRDFNERVVRGAEQKRHISRSDKIGPNFGKQADVDTSYRIEKKETKPTATRPGKKVVKEETTTGDIGSVQPSADNIGPNMGIPAQQGMMDTSPAAGGLSAANAGPAPGESAVDTTSRATWEDPMVQARKSMGFKRGGSVKKSFGHSHSHESFKQHSAGFKHHHDGLKAHAAGFKAHHEHVKTMCGGGKAKGK